MATRPIPISTPLAAGTRGADDKVQASACGEEADVDEMLTIEEIQAKYASDWVLIGDPQTDEALRVRAGKVLFHSPDHDEVCRKTAEHPLGRYALRFLGSLPDDLVLV